MNFQDEIINLISKAANVDLEQLQGFIEIPANKEMGDYAFPCFRLAKTLKKSPIQIANDIVLKVEKKDFIDKIEVVNAYINFYINKEFYIQNVLKNVFEQGDNYGKSNIGNNRNIVIDYSSPNIAKPFHIGHLRSTVIGNALYNIFNTLGYKSIGINHLGDWGTQFGKLIVAYKNWGDKEIIEKEGIKELSRIYVKFHDEAEKNDSLNDEARSWLVKMQNGDKEALELWKWFCDISLNEFKKVYDRINIKFDYYTGESFYNDKMDDVVKQIKEKNLLTESQGAMIVDLEKYNMPPCLILRSDGGTLYPTRDISAAIYRKEKFDFEKCIYVTAMDQNLHFAQWFKVIDLLGYNWADELIHVPFGLVSLDDGKLSTRKGHVVLMEDILNSAVEKTKKIIMENESKNVDIQNIDEVAEQVGIGAIIFNDLFNSRIKNVVFDWDRMLNFKGETGPYVQYTYVRTCGILNKAEIKNVDIEKINYSMITDELSIDVFKTIDEFPQKIIDAANKYEPYIITRYLVDICQKFNKFYNENYILNCEDDLKNARLALVIAVKNVIKNGLSILGISTPEKM